MRRWLAILLVLAVAGMSYSYWYMTRPHRLAALTGKLLEQLTGAQVHIDSADFTWSGAVELRGVRLMVPGLDAQQAKLFDAEQVLLQVDPWRLLHGQFTTRQITLVRPSLWLTEIGDDQFNFSVLQKMRGGDIVLPTLPRVYVLQGSLRFGEVHEGRYQQIGALQLAGSLNPDSERPDRYTYELYQYKSNDPSITVGAPLAGKFDLKNLTVDANLADFAFANPHRNMLPRQVRQWWDQFEPSGSLQNIGFGYDPTTGPKADVHIQGVAITLPMLTSKEHNYRARMTDVSGTFHFDAKQIRIDNLVGEIEGLQYVINGTIDGYGPEAPFNLTLKTLPFRIPEKPRYMVALPLGVQKAFGLLTPVGWLRVSMRMTRESAAGSIDYQGSAQILSGTDLKSELRGSKLATDLKDEDLDSHGHYEKFAYELNHCRGLITFNRNQIEVKNLTGDTGGGGTVTITGIITPAEPQLAVDIVVTAVRIPFDQKLYDALGTGQQRSLDAFFNRPQWERLHKAGFYCTTAEREACEQRRLQILTAIRAEKEKGISTATGEEELAKVQALLQRPAFDLGGHANVVVKVTRAADAGQDQPFDLHTTIDMTDANVVFEYFPYPVRVTGGRLILTHDQVVFDTVNAIGLRGGRGGISGAVDYVGEDRKVSPKVALQAIGLPLDELLFESLGEFRGRWLRQFQLAGVVNVATAVFRNKDDQIDFQAAVELRDNTALPGGGKFELTELRGKFTATLNTLKLENITGRRGDGEVRIDGTAEWVNPEKPTVNLAFAGKGLHFEDHVMDLVDAVNRGAAEGVKKTWDRHQPVGVFDADVSYAITAQGERDFNLQLRPKTLTLTHTDRRIAFTGVTGAVDVRGGVAHFDHVAADCDGGRISVNGTAKFTEDPEVDLAITASGDRFSPSFLALMPRSINDLITTLKLTGRYELDVPSFKLHSGAMQGRWLDAQGTLALTGASAQIGMGITDFHGQVNLHAVAEAGADRPSIDADISAKQLRVTDRLIQDFKMTMRPGTVSGNRAADSRMLIPSLSGKCAQGLIAGSGAIDLTDSRFMLQIALSDADLAVLAKSDRGPVAAPAPPPVSPPTAAAIIPEVIDGHILPAAKRDRPISGRVSASLALEGSWADTTQLRGRGNLVVREGQLYGVPMAFGLFRITHLALPVTDIFQSASLSYYVREDRVTFEQIKMDSKSMRLAGSGSMQLSSGDIDLTLTTSNPAGMDLGPVTDLLAKFRNQLLTVRVTGTLQEPVTRAQQFSGLKRAWNDVLGPK